MTKVFIKVLTLSILYCIQSINVAFSSNSKIDSLKTLHLTTTNSKIKLTTLILLSQNEDDLVKAIEYSEQAIYLADSLNLRTNKAISLNISGVLWKNFGHYSIAIEKLENANEIFEKTNNTYLLNKNKIDLAEGYRASIIFDEAIKNITNAILYFELVKDSFQIARSYNRLAAIYIEKLYKNEDFLTLSSNYSFSKKEILRELKKLTIPHNYFKIIEYSYKRSLEIATLTKNTELIFSNLILKSFLESQLNDFETSITTFKYIIEQSQKYNLKDHEILATINLARTYSKPPFSEFEKAIELALYAKKLSFKEQKKIYAFLANDILNFCYLKIGNYKIAYEFLLENSHLSKTFEGEKLRLSVINQEFNKRISKKEFELNFNKTINRILLISLSLIALSFTIFGLVITNKNKKLKRFLKVLKHKNDIISNQKEKLINANKDKDRIFSIIGHDLRNSISGITGLSLILTTDHSKLSNERIIKIYQLIYSSSKSISDILENLLNWGKMQFDKISFEHKTFEIEYIKEQLFLSYRNALENKNIKLIFETEKNLLLNTDRELLSTVLRNLVNNAIKFSYPNSEIRINFKQQDEFIKVSVKDQGIGIKKEIADSLLLVNKNNSKNGTQNEQGTGLGLLLCKELLVKFGGKIWLESEEGIGSTFYFTIKNTAPNKN